jgi:hypothetical protein
MLSIAIALSIALLTAQCASAQTGPPQGDKTPNDPFAGVAPATPSPETAQEPQVSWLHKFLNDNFGFRKEILSEFDTNADGSGASRQSLGFELQKKFSTATSTIAGFDFQGRLVRRDGYNAVPNDMEGAGHQGWTFEYHNLYLDLYNIFNPLLGADERAASVGRFNFRIGQSYVPFGLSLQTDTHGTLLQLSNGNNFGFDEGWSAGFWGAINKDLNYDASYLVGSGCGLKWRGQGGLGALRVSLSDKYSSQYGIEGGLSLIGGERLAMPMAESDGADPAAAPLPLRTQRIGIDGRYRHTAPKGLLTFTTELSGGRDASNPVVTELHQAEYLHGSRRWGVAAQVRRFFQESRGTNLSVIGELTWYFRNDVANSNAHWIKLNLERQLQNAVAPPHTIVTLQYYFYL